MNFGLKDRHFHAVLDILRSQKKVEKIVLFGSRARGTYSPESDVDICLFGDALDLTDQADLIATMEDLTIPQQVDLLLHHRIKEKALLDHIRKEGKVLFDRKRDGDTDVCG